MDFWKTKQFKTLLKVWDQKLESSGFCEREVETKNRRLLNNYRRFTQIEREARLEYYLFLEKLINQTPFQSNLEKIIMQKHSEGLSIQEIVQEIKLTGISRDRKTVRYIIRRWQVKWGIRSWSLKQRRLKE